ncbi:MAG: CCA tRNA nucleotidyltransferase [Parvularculaceae bacterium]|nr:CCA tRNA nucleotidyltransferase [Parvularculaceae bacterium]
MSDALAPLPTEAQLRFGWMRDPRLGKIVAALTAHDASAVRFVGGCVRDSLLGAAPKDIDLATTLTPDRVIDALHAAGLAAAPTGIDHGTVTAIADHFPVEVTSLRADVTTDGRRATVAYTTDWSTDARRRDFTINALYVTPDLQLFDPAGGVGDLANRRVRFIGAAEERIREDYLRILRFFRFSARFARAFDIDGLAACTAMRAGIKRLSAERVGDELFKILTLSDAARAVEAMHGASILAEIWPAAPAIETLRRLKELTPEAPPALGLAALWGADGEGVDAHLRASNADGRRRRRAVECASSVAPDLSEQAIRALIYRYGADGFRDALLLARARSMQDFARHEEVAVTFRPPALPFSGHDVLAAGAPEGPRVAAVLASAEARWIAEDFPPSSRAKAILAEEIARAISTG